MSTVQSLKWTRCCFCSIDSCGAYIQCNKCPSHTQICLQCFALGLEDDKHKKHHDYRIVDDGGFSVFSSDGWAANEELLLLEAVEQYGYGNWEDVAEHIVTRSPMEATEHYNQMYLDGHIGQLVLPETLTYELESVDHTCLRDGSLSPSLTRPPHPVSMTTKEQQMLGYMPLRNDFEREFDNDAEVLVSGLNVNPEDDELETAMKLAHADMYTRKLKERQRRKRIGREYGLITSAVRGQSSSGSTSKTKGLMNRRRNFKHAKQKEHNEVHVDDKFKPFCQFISSDEYRKLFDNLQKEKQLKTKIKELLKLRKNGATKLDDSVQNDSAKEPMKKKTTTNDNGILKKSTPKKMLTPEHGPDEEQETETKTSTAGDTNPHRYPSLRTTPGFSLLSDREKLFCENMCIRPAKYITVKTLIVADNLQRKHGLCVKTKFPPDVDRTMRKKVVRFLSENGWITGS